MGKLIQCSSVIAKEPYCFPMTKTNVYSIEEVCYYIRNNIYMMQEEVFDKEFAQWIRRELKMEVTADKLDQMRQDHNNLKDIVVTLCCSCDYYTESEINSLIEIMDETQNMPMAKRQEIKAESFLKSGSLEKARQEYESILKSTRMLEASEKDYGRVYHNLGVACAGMGEFRQAMMSFRKAYEQNKEPESMQCYLYSVLLSGNKEEYNKVVKEMELTQEQQVFLAAQYEDAWRLSGESKECHRIERIAGQYSEGDKDCIKRADALLQEWKQEYRQTMLR
jgi:tetratricopeptide (TPR) repeat protein